MTAPVLLVLGTASDAGKSTIATALCRLLRRRGFRVAPFKAQNMARNAFVTSEGGEIGVAQALQAFAAGVEPTVDMNPILLKPEPGMVSQVVVHGRAIGTMTFGGYGERVEAMKAAVRASLGRLRAASDVVVAEGAGSPAEVNLADRDLANLFVARETDASIVLVADIDRGGVFASIVGTLALLPDDLRPNVRGLVINKLRGDPRLLESGCRFLEERTGVPVLGVVPHLEALGLADEDSLGLARRIGRRRARLDELEIAVVAYPAIANAEDVLPLEREPGVIVRFVTEPRELEGADLVVLPGSKSTMHDLAFLKSQGFDRVLVARASRGEPILGICGGCQMLGTRIDDPLGIESSTSSATALGLLALETTFEAEKRTARVEGRLAGSPLFGGAAQVEGFEIHHGRTRRLEGARPAVQLERRGGVATSETDGAASEGGVVFGTMIHDLLEGPEAREGLLASLRARRGIDTPPAGPRDAREAAIERLADHVAASLDLAALGRILGERSE